MNTQIITSLNRFLAQQREYRGWIRLLKIIGAPKSLITRLERDMARHSCDFLLMHAFPYVLPHNAGNKSKVRRARPQAGSERAKSTTPATKGKK
jgi:hypothetical protein